VTDALTRILRAAGAALVGSLISSARTSDKVDRNRTHTDAAGSRPRPRTRATAPAPTAAARTSIREVPLGEALAHVAYDPSPDGDADPGEVVWTWVPYQEDATQGKDRPVVVLGRSGQGVYVAQMTSKDHDRDAAQEARNGRYWLDIGTGAWDSKGRPSEVRLDRALWVSGSDVRREGAVLPRATFDRVVAGLRTVAEAAGHPSGKPAGKSSGRTS